MSNLVFSVKSAKYGTPTGSNTMPASGDMKALSLAVKGSIVIEESAPAFQEFTSEWQASPVMINETTPPVLSATIQLYDLNYQDMAALKGGTFASAGGFDKFTPGTGFTVVQKALEFAMDSGHVLNIFNSNVAARIVSGGGRDKLFALELVTKPLMTADLAGDWELKKAQ